MPDGAPATGSSQAPTCQALQRLIGESPGMQRVRDQIARIARSPVPVLIVGETGTGKELCAEAIAQLSGREPFIPVNCAALPESLIESELFGHERGAFTGAVRSQIGVISAVNGGTLFLDELAEVPNGVQAKLLRTLESGEYKPLGSTRVFRSQFRILAATSGDLERIVSVGQLRTDLFHRLGAARVRLPPLRDRVEDIPLLVREVLRRYSERSASGLAEMSPGACALLMRQAWPGNVRQLRNVVEAAAAVAGGESPIDIGHVQEILDPFPDELPQGGVMYRLAEVRKEAERLAIVDALRAAAGNRERAAKLLGISEATLYRKLGRDTPPREVGRRAARRNSESKA